MEPNRDLPRLTGMDDFEQTQPIGDQIRRQSAREDPPPLTPADVARLDRIAAVLRDVLPPRPTRMGRPIS